VELIFNSTEEIDSVSIDQTSVATIDVARVKS